MTPVAPGPRRAARASQAARRRSAEFIALANAAEDAPYPLVLQRRASRTLRGHALRSTLRVGALVVADLLALLVARGILHLVDGGLLGDAVAGMMRALVPHGTYPFAQLATAMLAGLLLLGTYQSGDHRHDARGIVLGVGFGVLLTLWSHLWSAFDWHLVVGAEIAMLALGGLLLGERKLVDWMTRRVRQEHGHSARVVVVGSQLDAERALTHAVLSDPSEFQVIGFVDNAPVPAEDSLGSLADLVDVIEHWKVDTLVMAGSFDERQWAHLVHVADAAGCHALTLPGTLMLEGFAPQLVWRRGMPLVQITRPGLRGHQLLLKRALDATVAAATLALLAPLLVGIALAVKLTSRGPIFFRQTRVGQGGRFFKIVKFRSMVVDAEARLAMLKEGSVYEDGRLFKMERDPRITRVGAFLRRTSLDELPQLWNVLVGHMSLVGPRPPIPAEVDLYDDHHYTRFDVKPGITGPWQVSGRNRIRDFEEVVRLETAYIRDWDLGKDIGILLRTVPAVLRMDGAY